jgi:hypothetical protein
VVLRYQLHYGVLIVSASSILTQQFLNTKIISNDREKKSPFALLETINKYVVLENGVCCYGEFQQKTPPVVKSKTKF